MPGAVRTAFVVLAVGVAARAEDPPPTKHVNVVTPEARAAIERYVKLVYRPAEHGLSSVSAVLAYPDGSASPGRFRFVPPTRVAFEPGAAPVPVTNPVAALQFRLPLRAAFEGMPLIEEAEHDAEIVEKDGAKWLVVTSFINGGKDRTDEFAFDAAGLLAKARPGLSLPEGAPQPEISFAWSDVSGLHRVEAMELSMGDASHAVAWKFRLAYSDVLGVNLLTSFTTDLSARDGGKDAHKFAPVLLDALVVNGSPVDVPRPGVHRNRVSPDAKAAIDAYARLVYRPVDRGLVSATGTIACDETSSAKFDYHAPNALAVWATRDARQAAPLHRVALLAALDGVRIVETYEFDADFVGEGAARVLRVVEYKGDVKTATVDYSLDAAGLVTSLRRRGGVDPAAPTSDLTTRVTWAICGKLRRVESCDVIAGPPDSTALSHFAFRYAAIDGIELPVAYVRTDVQSGKDAKAVTYRLEALVVNGKAASPPK